MKACSLIGTKPTGEMRDLEPLFEEVTIYELAEIASDLHVAIAQRDARIAELDRFVEDTQTRLCAVIEARDARIAEFESLARMVVDGQLTETEHERGIYRRGFRELLAAAKGE